MAAIMHRNFVASKLYTDLTGIVSSIFSGRISPITAPETTIRQLIQLNPDIFKSTVYLDDPTLIYSYATAIPTFPVQLDRIAYVMAVPTLMRANVTPIYCPVTLGVLNHRRHGHSLQNAREIDLRELRRFRN